MKVEKMMVTRREAAEMIGVSLATLDRMRARGDFPPGAYIGPYTVRYPVVVVNDWIQAQADAAGGRSMEAAQRAANAASNRSVGGMH